LGLPNSWPRRRKKERRSFGRQSLNQRARASAAYIDPVAAPVFGLEIDRIAGTEIIGAHLSADARWRRRLAAFVLRIDAGWRRHGIGFARLPKELSLERLGVNGSRTFNAAEGEQRKDNPEFHHERFL
jgi:hypothetical protein